MFLPNTKKHVKLTHAIHKMKLKEEQASRNHTGLPCIAVESMTRSPVLKLISIKRRQYETVFLHRSILESVGVSITRTQQPTRAIR